MHKELYKIQTQEFSIDATGGKVNSIRNKDITKSSARIFKEGSIYSSSYVGDISEEDLVQKANSNVNGKISYDYELQNINHEFNKKCLCPEENAKIKILEAYQNELNKLQAEFPNFIFSGKASYTRTKKSLNKMREEHDEFVWYFIYRYKDSPSIMDGYFGAANITKWDFETELKRYKPYLAKFENIVNIENGKYPVVFASSEQLIGKLAESCRVDLYKKGSVVFNDQLGNKIISEKVTLQDVSYEPENGAFAPFDGEGFVRSDYKLNLIENGVFKNLIADSRNAKKFGVKPTGNAIRSFDSGVRLGFNTLLVEKGSKPINELVKKFDKCLIIEMAGGGDFTDKGDFSSPVQMGYLLQKGNVVGKLPQITLKSSLQKMFGEDLIDIACDSLSGLEHNPALVMQMELFNN